MGRSQCSHEEEGEGSHALRLEDVVGQQRPLTASGASPTSWANQGCLESKALEGCLLIDKREGKQLSTLDPKWLRT